MDESAIEALRSDGNVVTIEPSDDELRPQLGAERGTSHAHLRRIVDEYWEPEWRRRHRGEAAEDQMWRAAAGLVEIDAVLDEIGR